MLSVLYTEVNIVGATVLLIMITNWKRSNFKNLPVDQKIFNGVMLFNLLIFIFDTGMWLTDGRTLPFMKTLNYITTTIYYILNPAICFLWLMYTDFKIHESSQRLSRNARLFSIPVVISAIISILSPFTGWYFTIDENNRYSRGPLFIIMAVISLLYLLHACAIALADSMKSGWITCRGLNLYLLVFPVGVIAAAIIQIEYYGLSIIWITAMLGCTSIYVKIQNTEISTDYITGLYNRRSLDQHLKRKISTKHADRLLFAIVLDLDDFKKINDIFGHMEGDIALTKVAELLRASCRKYEDFIARLGGDEFIIVGERHDLQDIEVLMNTLRLNALTYNQSQISKYPLTISMGYSVYKNTDTEDTFLAAADKEMYRCKQGHKADITKGMN